LTVKADEIRSLLGLSKPEPEDQVIGGRGMEAPLQESTTLALNAAGPEAPEGLEELLEEQDLVEISEDIAWVLEQAANTATDFTTFQNALHQLVSTWPPDKIVPCLALATFKARALGAAAFADTP
jgi:hypothetical protein